MKRLPITLITLILLSLNLQATENQYVQLSQSLIRAAKIDSDRTQLLQTLEMLTEDELAEGLQTDNEKKAFWVNVYNAHIQFFLKDHPEWYDDRGSFFKTKRVVVAGKTLSFDDIEHGIIRRSKSKLSLGFLPSFRVDKFERKFRVSKVDGRIHFALNCGAKSCPAVASYDDEKLDEQFDKSTSIHLKNTSKFVAEENRVYITSLFSWFRADFGSKKQLRKFLKKYDIIPDDSKPTVSYNKYDWTLDLDNFIEL